VHGGVEIRLFILAAGTGSRLFPLTKNTPKSLLDLGDGTTLLDRQIRNAELCPDIDHVYILSGYKTEQIEARIKSYHGRIGIDCIYNPFYDVSNNLLTLWCARDYMHDKDFIVTNGDNLYADHVFRDIVSGCPDSDCIQLTIDYKDHYDDDDMKVCLDTHGRVLRVSKEIEPGEFQAESVGLVIVRGNFQRKLFAEKLLELSKDISYRNRFWLEIFNSLVADSREVTSFEIEQSSWREMDFHPDIEKIKTVIMGDLFRGFEGG
jgi:choline kinase